VSSLFGTRYTCGKVMYLWLMICRLSQFAKSGGESYLFDALHVSFSESDKRVVVIVCIDSCCIVLKLLGNCTLLGLFVLCLGYLHYCCTVWASFGLSSLFLSYV